MASRTVEENAQLIQALQTLDATISMKERAYR
jgi:hypothetical protein